jgi:prenylcysteine oxidase/farnesylcysteine lyase
MNIFSINFIKIQKMFKQTITLCVLILTLNNNPTRIAIIGSGIGGSSAAHYLLKNPNIKVDIYEKGDHVGGRLLSMDINGKHFDFGSPFMTKASKLLYGLATELGCQPNYQQAEQKMSIISGHEILISMSSSYAIINMAKLFWKYGLAPYWVMSLMNSRNSDYQKIYEYLDNKITFANLSEMLQAIKQSDLIYQTVEDLLIADGISQQYIDEIVSSLLAVMYIQHKEMNAFAGFVSLSGMGEQPFNIVGGMDHIVESIIAKHQSNPNFKLYLNKKVSRIIKQAGNLYNIDGVEYDKVIIACPLEKIAITFEAIAVKSTLPHYFQESYVTLMQGEINGAFFNLKDGDFIPNAIAANDKKKSEHVASVIYMGDGIIKLQSDTELPDRGLTIVKDGYKILHQEHWDFAYPKFVRNKLEDLPSFVLDDGLYYINAIETAASSMELSMISARNIVNIIEKEISADKNTIKVLE